MEVRIEAPWLPNERRFARVIDAATTFINVKRQNGREESLEETVAMVAGMAMERTVYGRVTRAKRWCRQKHYRPGCLCFTGWIFQAWQDVSGITIANWLIFLFFLDPVLRTRASLCHFVLFSFFLSFPSSFSPHRQRFCPVFAPRVISR